MDYSVGIDMTPPVDPIVEPTWMATIDFTIASGSDLCEVADLVEFRWHTPPTRLSDGFGESIPLAALDLDPVTIDSTPPDITCPVDVTVNADAGGCDALVSVGTATATDDCDSAPVITWTRSDGAGSLSDPYTGVTTITWQAVDACENASECVQTITVDPFNEMLVSVELSPNIDTDGALPDVLSRCITFELWDCVDSYGPVEIQQVIDFEITAGTPNVALGSAMLLVPCDVYDCVTARDTLHTLRRTDEAFGIVGTQYVADFTTDVDTGGDWLVGGNLNDDNWIDVLDFGVFVWQFHFDYGTGDTDCSTMYPHADISGDGFVDSDDFSFIQINFLQGHEANCCGGAPMPLGAPQMSGSYNGPVTRISLRQLARRGMPQLIVADLNHDGWLDVKDMQEFTGGERP